MGVRDEHLSPWPRTPDIIKASIADYYALISHLDNKIGTIIETLFSLGLFDNTIIVFAGDNGLAIGSHGLLGKQNLYEHSVKVPVIITGPGVPKEKVNDALVYLYDLYPTLCKLCNLPAPSGIDGKNLVPVMKGESRQVRNTLYTAYRNSIRAIRDNEWKLIQYPKSGYMQLFHLKNDPLEISNLAQLPAYHSKLGEMTEKLKEEYKASGDTVNLFPRVKNPVMIFDYSKIKQKPDQWQPDYTLKRYFQSVEEQ
jgi:arylsulfatase A-like enzyme